MGNQQIKQLNRTRLRVTHTGEWRGSFHLSMHARRMDIVRVTVRSSIHFKVSSANHLWRFLTHTTFSFVTIKVSYKAYPAFVVPTQLQIQIAVAEPLCSMAVPHAISAIFISGQSKLSCCSAIPYSVFYSVPTHIHRLGPLYSVCRTRQRGFILQA